jgi:class 3 adenylate cyclase/cell division protein FtsN
MAKQKKDDVEGLLKARAEIDAQLRQHKTTLTVLFTDIVGSTQFYERNGDTAGLAMVYRHDRLATSVIQEYGGRVVKTIGDSAMAEFSDPISAVRAAAEIERQLRELNLTLSEKRISVRIGIHTGVAYRKGNDLFGDVVNVAARIVKRAAPDQILISSAVYEAASQECNIHCEWLNKFSMAGRMEKEDIFEVKWADEVPRQQTDSQTNSSTSDNSEATVRLGMSKEYSTKPRTSRELPVENRAERSKPLPISSGTGSEPQPDVDTPFRIAMTRRTIQGWEVSIERVLRRIEMKGRKILHYVVHAIGSFMKQANSPLSIKARKSITLATVTVIFLAGIVILKRHSDGSKAGERPPAVYTAAALPSSKSSSAIQATTDRPGLALPHAVANRAKMQNVDLDRNYESDDWDTESTTVTSHTGNPTLQLKLASTRAKSSSESNSLKSESKSQHLKESKENTFSDSITVAPAAVTKLSRVKGTIEESEQTFVTSEPTPENINVPPPVAELDGPSQYLEVGSFKDESWANAAIEKLTQLGFHAILIHKQRLWVQSYHVEVGPYGNSGSIAAARQILDSQGFKVHPAK